MPWRCTLALACLGTVSAQNLSLGIAAGGAPTDAFEASTIPEHNFYSQSADYLIGATLEYHLPPSFSIEADGLFRELHLTETATNYPHVPVVTWEFPVLAKYRFRGSKVTPFVEAGPEFRTAGNLNETKPSHDGVAAGVGVETHWRGLDIAPVVRYTRWARDNNPSPGPESKSDQLEVLLGISSRSRSLGKPFGGHFALGVIAGMTLTHDLPSYSQTFQVITQFPPPPGGSVQMESETISGSGLDTFLVGPALEMALSPRFYIEADAVYHQIRDATKSVLDGTTNFASSGTQASTWEFPVLAKFKFGSGRFKPFAEAGPSFRLPVQHISVVGFTVGGGVEIRWRALKIAPAIRYTRWMDTTTPHLYPDPQPNQVEFLTGFLL
jgi:hypothetical protein